MGDPAAGGRKKSQGVPGFGGLAAEVGEVGVDHERLTYRFGGRDHRLTDVHGRVIQAVLA